GGGSAGLRPPIAMVLHAGDESRELRMLVDGGLDGRFLHGEIDIAGAEFLEQCVPELGAHLPVALERIDIGDWDAALQVARDVLEILGRLAVDVPGHVEIETILLNLLERDHTRVLRDIELFPENVDDLVDVLLPQAILGTIPHEAAAGVDHENALAGLCAFFVHDHNAGWDASTIEQVRGQPNDALEVTLPHQGSAD